MELSFRITFSLSRKFSGYELPAISKWHNVISKQMIKRLLNIIFGQNEGSMDKLEYWTKYRFFELIELLERALEILKDQESGASDNFNSPKEFALALDDERDSIEFGNQTDLKKIWTWFAPTCDWDDIVDSEHQNIANEIFEIANSWQKVEG